MDNHLREIMDLKFDNAEKALKIQALEYERRLENLNHEAERLREMQSTYVPREVYEANQKENRRELDNIKRLIYIGVGIAITTEIVLRFI